MNRVYFADATGRLDNAGLTERQRVLLTDPDLRIARATNRVLVQKRNAKTPPAPVFAIAEPAALNAPVDLQPEAPVLDPIKELTPEPEIIAPAPIDPETLRKSYIPHGPETINLRVADPNATPVVPRPRLPAHQPFCWRSGAIAGILIAIGIFFGIFVYLVKR